MKKVKDLCMMFSGGVDTTLAAAKMLEDDLCERLHLLTFCNGFCVRVGSSRVHVDELRRKYGEDRVVHEIIYVTDIFEELRAPLLELVKEYKSTLVFDLCCRLSFETAAVIYSINNDIQHVCDGTNIDQGKLFLERPEYMRVAKEYFASFGIDYFSPVYAKSGGRKGRMKELTDRGLSVGPKAFEKLNITSSLFHQPFCLIGIHTFFFTSFIRNAPGVKQVVSKYNLSVDEAIRLRLNRQEIARRIVAERTAEVTAQEAADGITIKDRFCTTRLCGTNGVEIALPRGTKLDLDLLERIWSKDSKVERDGSFIETRQGKLKIQAWSTGRIIVNGTKDRDKAVALYEDVVAAHDVFSAGA